ncbi:S8 family peptidase [Arthrobacter psychrochitiniphilus]|uniref:Peptidase S8 n=1 Tax=Arthrobacter psychrochitiniphilus TaxID=291045 RepID=A0A2V3DWH7_9MICC|nr:S8 family serine peptidase [Arthrobacter psychrochitiniphilus]PXA69649.1 peptidase S8 [Arthrobacter psychrochitiniphilus]
MQLAPRLRAVAAALITLALAGSLAVVGAPAASADDIRNREYWLQQSGIAKAWELSQGEGVKVAIIDSGIDADHIDLKGAVVGGIDMSGEGNKEGTKGIGAEPEHGTLVATMLGGRGHNASTASPSKAAPKASSTAKAKATVGAGPDGVIGVAPKAELLSISVWLGSENPSGRNIDDQIPAAVTWAVDQGAKIINMSLGSSSTAWPQSWDDAFAYAEANDVLIVAAAGNRKSGSEQVGAPATIPGVLAVGGLDRDGTASIDSSSQGISIGVSAPAEDLAGGLPSGGYASWNGTSGAAPIVSGVAALIRSKYPSMSAAQVINRIISTAKPKGAGVPNAIYGYGILDAEAALSADVPEVTDNPMGSISEWIRVHRRGAVVAPTNEGGTPVTSRPQPKPTLSDAHVPVAITPELLGSPLPQALVLGSAGLLVLILAAGSGHLLLARRRVRAGEAGGPAYVAAAGEAGGSGGDSGSGAASEAPPEPSLRPRQGNKPKH